MCSALLSVFMRISEDRIKSSMMMFFSNYVVCGILSIIFAGTQRGASINGSFSLPVALGLISGILYLAGFLFFKKNIEVNGMVLASTFMKLGVMVPTVIAYTLFGEKPSILRCAGVVLAVLSIVLINAGGSEGEKDGAQKASVAMLVLLLLIAGVTDSMAGIYSKFGNPDLKDFYLLFTFGCAGCFALVMFLKERANGGATSLWDVFMGILIGLPNYFCSRFLLLSLNSLEAGLVYPVYSVGTIVLVTLIGFTIFREKLEKRKIVALITISISLVMLNA